MLTRASICPLFSSATKVLSKVGASGSSAIFATSARCRRIASVKAGAKSASLIFAKSGAWNGSVLGASNGLALAAAGASAASAADMPVMGAAKQAAMASARAQATGRRRFMAGSSPCEALERSGGGMKAPMTKGTAAACP